MTRSDSLTINERVQASPFAVSRSASAREAALSQQAETATVKGLA